MEQDRLLRVLALVPYPLGGAPGQRYRIEQWAPLLRDEGIDVTFSPFGSERLSAVLYEPARHFSKVREMVRCALKRAGDVLAAGRFDVVFLYREASLIGPALLERVARVRNPRIVFDFDDAIWLRYVSPRNSYLSYLKAPGKTAAICRLARHVTVGNEHLAAYARRYNPNVTVLPSTIPLSRYQPRPPGGASEVPVIGWTGSHSSMQYLRLVAKPLQRLAERRSFRFLVIGVDDFRIPGIPVETRPWNSDTEARDLWDIDVGIMPLHDDPWARGKCAMKAIQYHGVGVPAVVSPVGANCEVVRHGENGFHAATEDEWLTSLERLLVDPELRRRLGSAGRDAVEARYSAESQAPRLARILRGVAA